MLFNVLDCRTPVSQICAVRADKEGIYQNVIYKETSAKLKGRSSQSACSIEEQIHQSLHKHHLDGVKRALIVTRAVFLTDRGALMLQAMFRGIDRETNSKVELTV